MIAAVLLAAVALPLSMYGVYRLERWSQAREARAAARRAAQARDLIANHPGATDDFAVQLRSWLDAGQGQAVAR